MAKSKSAEGELNKRELVQAAFEAKGDAPPGELQAFIKETYGKEIEIGIISSYKSNIKKKLGLGRVNKKKRGRPAGSTNAPRAEAKGNMVNLDDLQAVSELVKKMGAEKVMSMVQIASNFSK